MSKDAQITTCASRGIKWEGVLAVWFLFALCIVPARAQETEPSPKQKPIEFTISLRLSDKASAKLRESKETIIVVAELGYQIAPDGEQEAVAVELKEPKDIHVNRSAYPKLEALGHPDYQVAINVYSGRKSSEYNLLDCGFFSSPLKDVNHKTITIYCKIIGEPLKRSEPDLH